MEHYPHCDGTALCVISRARCLVRFGDMAVCNAAVKLAWPPLRRRLMIPDLAPRREAVTATMGHSQIRSNVFSFTTGLRSMAMLAHVLKSGAIIEK